jgi:hypothetical protein
MSEIVQFGYRELWVVAEDGWSLPIYCDPYTADGRTITHWSVRPALEMLAAPFTEISSRFSPYNLSSESRSWVVDDERLRKIATKASGCMPRDYMKWTSDKPGKEMDGRELIVDEAKDDEFLGFICKRYSIDRPLARFFWRAIKDGMLYWFKNAQKPVDFEIFSIHPIPYRANWKEIMLSKHRDSPKLFRKKRPLWRGMLVETGFMEDLGSTDLMAMNMNRTFSWNLEIKMSKLLMDELADGEKIRSITKRPVKYAKYYEGCIRRRLTDIIEIYSSWLKQVEQPVGSIRESMLSSDPILVPQSKRNKVLPSWHRPNEVTYQPAANVPKLKQGYRKPKNMEKALKKMFQMPDLLPGAEDVRQLPPPPAVDGPGNDGNGASGVRVCDVDKDKTESSGLLAAGEEPKP